MTHLALVSLLSLVVQFLVDRLKSPIPEIYRVWAVPLLVMITSITLAFCCSVVFLTNFGMQVNPIWVDHLVSGLVISGGGTLTNELIKLLRGLKEVTQESLNK